ncbi:hypothetical protein [Deinococcus aquiradiocola]|nr:hypothetical protein [Deinococcus aquiradiocola]
MARTGTPPAPSEQMVIRLFRRRTPQERFDRAAHAFRTVLADEGCPRPPAHAWQAYQDGTAARNDQDLLAAAAHLEREVRRLHSMIDTLW